MSIEPTSSRQQKAAAAAPKVRTEGAVNPAAGARSGIADNFQSFLTLLTTQLQHQNPLDPLNVNQFTQQLVQFAQVEQQLKGNTLLERLVEAQKSAQSTQALMLVGRTAVVDGSEATLAKGSAVWNLRSPKSVTATVSVTNATGQLVYSGTRVLNSGDNGFAWNGQASNGVASPPGPYKLVVDAKDAAGRSVAVSAEAQGVVESVDLTKNPIMLSIGGRNYALGSVRRVLHGGG
ncbi:flagellar hook assembly protein FlgD [Bradyrhizobium sp. SRS-191]|uniref:flagellar hook assembly protein FlgD n=1 Tax=Bradyrhizobium sp. SRS-191 TaxID=2962606 RepID=UPI00211F078E|nr:flagellar hook assembly protein FlgD [Bradyrhizobium sp. SRS-191]